MDDRRAEREKENRRSDKQARQDELLNLVQQIARERAEEREALFESGLRKQSVQVTIRIQHHVTNKKRSIIF